VAGEANEYLIRALMRAHKLDISSLDGVPPEKLSRELTSLLGRLYPEKWAFQGEGANHLVAERAVAAAGEHGLTRPAGAVLFAALAFFTGSGFAQDPQLPWVAETLASSLAPDAKIDQLHKQSLAFVDFGLS
jgi:hypothetical protein